MRDWLNWNEVLWLLRARPAEFVPHDPLAARLRSAAKVWSNRSELTDEERNRIRSVWLEDEHRPAIGLTADRTNVLRTLR